MSTGHTLQVGQEGGVHLSPVGVHGLRSLPRGEITFFQF